MGDDQDQFGVECALDAEFRFEVVVPRWIGLRRGRIEQRVIPLGGRKYVELVQAHS